MRITVQQLRERIAAGQVVVYEENLQEPPPELDEETRWWLEGGTATLRRLHQMEWLDQQQAATSAAPGVSRR